MFELPRFIQRIKDAIPLGDVATTLEKLPKNPELNQISDSAGMVGGVIKIALHVIDQVYKITIPIEKRLAVILMRILVESAKDSLPYSVSNMKVDEIVDKESESFENIILELFESKDNNDAMVTDIREHPVFQRFKKMLGKWIENFNKKNQHLINSAQFYFEYDSNVLIKLGEEKNKNEEFSHLLVKWKLNSDFLELMDFFKNAKQLFLEVNKIDGKPLKEYYVENKAYEVDKETWGADEDSIKSKKEWNISSFLKSKDDLIVIAAPFGIGKSSMTKKIAYDCATQFINDPTDVNGYLPVFVQLKFALDSTIKW